MKNPRLKDISGMIFGRWTVTHKEGNTIKGAAVWLCECSCGFQKIITGGALRSGQTTMCKGCSTSLRFKTHGETNSKLHRIWKGMRTRCNNPNASNYSRYGAKGVKVCPDWNKFENFKEWAASSGYKDGLTLDRKNGAKGYSPENCRWATHKEQSVNREFVKKNGDGIPWSEVAKSNGISMAAYRTRIYDGWSFEEASSWPMFKKRPGREGTRDEFGRYIR